MGLDDDRFAALLSGEFGRLATGNDPKRDAVRPEQGTFDFEPVDRLVEFVAANSMTVTGHTLV